MSDPAPPGMTMDEGAADIEAVMDTVGSKSAVIFGVSGGATMGLSLAATRPERVAGLVLYSPFGRVMATEDYPWGWTEEWMALYQASLEMAWTTGRGVELAMPTVSGDQALLDWVTRYLRLSVSPARMRGMLEACRTSDVRHLLPDVATPTLILHRVDDQWMDAGNSAFVADAIADSQYATLPGADYWPWLGDQDSVLEVVEPFLDGLSVDG